MNLPTTLDYPIVAIGDLHGQREWLERLVARLELLPDWPAVKLVFLGDLVDRGPDVKGTVRLVMDLIAAKPGSTCVTGNHDLALVKAAGLDGQQSEYWVRRYYDTYDHTRTFRSYLGRNPDYYTPENWRDDLAELRGAVPPAHREFLARLPWAAEAAGHLFLHNGLSPELDCPATVQAECLRRKVWDRDAVNPKFGTETDRQFEPMYPVWLGADKKLSADPLPFPGKIQVSGHVRVEAPDANAVRVRIDTSGGALEPLTACVLWGPTAPPEFVFSGRSPAASNNSRLRPEGRR